MVSFGKIFSVKTHKHRNPAQKLYSVLFSYRIEMSAHSFWCFVVDVAVQLLPFIFSCSLFKCKNIRLYGCVCVWVSMIIYSWARTSSVHIKHKKRCKRHHVFRIFLLLLLKLSVLFFIHLSRPNDTFSLLFPLDIYSEFVWRVKSVHKLYMHIQMSFKPGKFRIIISFVVLNKYVIFNASSAAVVRLVVWCSNALGMVFQCDADMRRCNEQKLSGPHHSSNVFFALLICILKCRHLADRSCNGTIFKALFINHTTNFNWRLTNDSTTHTQTFITFMLNWPKVMHISWILSIIAAI